MRNKLAGRTIREFPAERVLGHRMAGARCDTLRALADEPAALGG